MKTMRWKTRIAAVGVAVGVLLLAGCAQVSKVATGEVTVRDRLTVTTTTTWNQFERGLGDNTPTWTQEGIAVDALQFVVGLKDGELVAPTPSEPKGVRPLVFRASMTPADIVKLYETAWTRDGSTFTLERVAPETFAGLPGFRFDYMLVRRTDEVRLRGMVVGAVKGNELFLIHYSAPRLAFFPRYQAQVEALVKTARIR